MPKTISKILIVAAIIALAVQVYANDGKLKITQNNAAYFYLKAFSVCKNKPVQSEDLYAYVAKNGKLTPEIKKYLKQQQIVFQLFDQAADINDCDWGFNFKQDILQLENHTSSVFGNHEAERALFICLAYMRTVEKEISAEDIHKQFQVIFKFKNNCNLLTNDLGYL